VQVFEGHPRRSRAPFARNFLQAANNCGGVPSSGSACGALSSTNVGRFCQRWESHNGANVDESFQRPQRGPPAGQLLAETVEDFRMLTECHLGTLTATFVPQLGDEPCDLFDVAGRPSIEQISSETGDVVLQPGIGALDGALRTDERVDCLERFRDDRAR